MDDRACELEDNLFTSTSDYEQQLAYRCSVISTIIRNLSFVPGNDVELCKSKILLSLLSRLMVLRHEHELVVAEQTENNDEDSPENSDQEFVEYMHCVSYLREKNFIYRKIRKENEESGERRLGDQFWWECVHMLRENTLVTLSNVSGALNLNNLDEQIIENFSLGTVHWIVCKSHEAVDPLSTTSETNMLSAQRLCIEILSKLSINDINIDLICASLNRTRYFMQNFVHVICREYLCKREEQTQREFSVVVLCALAKSDQFVSRVIAKYTTCFLSFIEDFEEVARRCQLLNPNHLHYHPNFIQSSNQTGAPNGHNPRVLNEHISNINEENLGTTIDMIRRCSNTLAYLSMYSENVPFILKYENRILDLVTSQFVDFKVAQILSEVLYNCSVKS